MAVRAANHTLGDLRLDAHPTRPVRDHRGNVESLVAQVIELEHHDVLLTTIDARMRQEILDRAPAIVLAFPRRLDEESRPLSLGVLPVVPLVGLGEARAAPRLELLRLGSSDWRELIERLRLAAARAGLHLHT